MEEMKTAEMTEEQKAERQAELIVADALSIYEIVRAVVDAGWEITTIPQGDEVWVGVKRGGIAWNSDAYPKKEKDNA